VDRAADEAKAKAAQPKPEDADETAHLDAVEAVEAAAEAQ
jgi:hypothetical protein